MTAIFFRSQYININGALIETGSIIWNDESETKSADNRL